MLVITQETAMYSPTYPFGLPLEPGALRGKPRQAKRSGTPAVAPRAKRIDQLRSEPPAAIQPFGEGRERVELVLFVVVLVATGFLACLTVFQLS
jgi:hypothetical protein